MVNEFYQGLPSNYAKYFEIHGLYFLRNALCFLRQAEKMNIPRLVLLFRGVLTCRNAVCFFAKRRGGLRCLFQGVF